VKPIKPKDTDPHAGEHRVYADVFKSPQEAINEVYAMGGGVVYWKDANSSRRANLNIPPNVRLELPPSDEEPETDSSTIKCSVDAALFDSLKDAVDFVEKRGGGVVYSDLAETQFAKSIVLPPGISLKKVRTLAESS
jgi:hypothetical protein